MSAVKAVHYLLANNATLIATVPAAKIFTGKIPLGEQLPAIATNEISTVEWNSVGQNAATTLATSRVQVTVQAKTDTEQKAILALVLKACPNQRGTVNGVSVDSIVPEGAGPDLRDDEAGIYMQSRDFTVKWVESLS